MTSDTVKINKWSGNHNGVEVLSVNFKGHIYNLWGEAPHDVWTSPLPFEGNWYGTERGWHPIKFNELPEKVKQEALLWRMSQRG